MNLSKAFLPRFLKEVMTHIPTLAMKSMDWRGTLKELGPLAARLGRKKLDDESFQSLQKLAVAGLGLTRASLQNNYDTLTTQQKNDSARVALRLYFSQLKNPDGLNLDLRPKHFRREDAKTCYCPNNAWFCFRESFRLALIDLYRGFYHDQDELFEQALKRVGLAKNLDHAEILRLEGLFREHFGPGDQEEVLFDLEHFKESFYQLFKYFMDHQVELEKDFMFLGIYLVGLYTHLQELGVPVNVREVFLEIFPE